MRNTRRSAAVIAAAVSTGLAIAGSAGIAAATSATAGLTPQLVGLPHAHGLISTHRDALTACTLPDGTFVDGFHCYAPSDIRTAYGVDGVAGRRQHDREQLIARNLTVFPSAWPRAETLAVRL